MFSSGNHGFFCDQRASYNAAASRDAWALATSFLSGR
ncbi:MAG: dienelactone hydrolase family protein [Thermoanaerobaculia bacterium]